MAGRRKEPCEFCEEQFWQDDGRNGHALHIEIYPDNNVISITSFARDEMEEMEELSASIELNYCPKCGRKLMW